MSEKLPPGPFGAIMADPPWTFATYSAKGKGRSAEQHYGCMSLDDIKALPVADVAAPDCCLFLWATNPMLPQALEVMAAWGFAYKTVAFCWTKPGFMGLGYWTRANAELCLLGTRGKPKRQDAGVRMLIEAKRREHSRKPDEARDRIARLVPGPYCELFAREQSPGWSAWGLEIDRFKAAA